MRSIMLCESLNHATTVYTPEAYKYLQEAASLDEKVYCKADVLANPTAFHDVDYIFSTWGMPGMTEEEIATAFPNAKCVFYGAGSVQGFARPFLHQGIKVFSSWAANAIPVAEFTLAQILLANTGYFHLSRQTNPGDYEASWPTRKHIPGNFNVSVGIIGVGMIGKVVIELLKPFNIHVKAYSPSLTDEKAAALGVERSTIEDIFKTCFVVSNHMANLPTTQRMLGKKHFASMLPYATFLNTGRGAQVNEEELIEVLTERPDLMAVLDVTSPEPPVEGSPFYSLPNVVLTPHIAGSLGNEVCRMGDYMVEEFKHYINGETCEYEVSEKMLERMA